MAKRESKEIPQERSLVYQTQKYQNKAYALESDAEIRYHSDPRRMLWTRGW